MIPDSILQYLDRAKVPYALRPHPRAITAQELAAAVHVTGHRVAKSVIVEADGDHWIAVLPADRQVNLEDLADAISASEARLADESEFDQQFPGCEVGAEPPFGKLFNLPVVCDEGLARDQTVVFRAGSHSEALEMEFEDYARLERPLIGSFARPLGEVAAEREEARPGA
jgi:Ala-tRNA(Pro) deacylase